MTDHAILEPLSDATKDALKPLRLRSNDYIEIGVEDDKHLFARVVTLRPITEEEVRFYAADKVRIAKDGRKFIQAWIAPSDEAKTFLARIPESKYLGAANANRPDDWQIAATDYTVVMTHHCWPKDRIIFISDEAETMFTYYLRRFMAQTARAELQARFKIDNNLPAMPQDFVDHSELPLSPAQRAAVLYGLGHEGTAYFMDKGTGKTATAIGRICLEAKRTRLGQYGPARMMKVLIIVPKKARLNWEREFERFATVPGKVVAIRSWKLERLKSYTHIARQDTDCAFSAAIVAYDTAANDVDILCKFDWDVIVCDESHNFKSDRTKRWKFLLQLRDHAMRRIALTGTPIGNSIFDLYTQLEWLFEGGSGFNTFGAFRRWHGKFERGVEDASGHAVERLVGYENVPLLQERLARLSFSVTKKEAGLNLPDKVYSSVEVEMTAKQTEFYKKMAEHLAIEIEEYLASSTLPKQITAENVLTRLMRLAQITSGFVKWNAQYDIETGEQMPGHIEQIPGGNPKIDAMLEELLDPENDPNEKTIVWAIFREDLRAIADALTAKGIKHTVIHGGINDKAREQAEWDFNNDPTVKVLVANPQAAGDSLNFLGYDWQETAPKLSTYTGCEMYFSCNWSYLLRSQSEDRAHRRGTKCTVRIVDLVVPGTIDEEIRQRILQKERTALEIQDIREILQRVLESATSLGSSGNGEE